MNILFRTFDRCGQPIFIALAFLTLLFWFPLLWAWVVIDPPYRWAMWRKKGIKPITQLDNRPPNASFNKNSSFGTNRGSRRNDMTENPNTALNKKP
jgi:hypothetical protein